MNLIQVVTGSIAPLPRANVDTDQIMPKNFLKRIERTGYGEFVFWDWRRLADGELNPDFVLNKEEYQDARVLVTGPNFGSGSSREHAPWGIQDWGFDAVIAPSFADIFYTNCTKIGLLPIVLSEKECTYLIELADHDPQAEVTIDLTAQTVSTSSFEAIFEINGFTKYRLLNGLDDIGLTLQQDESITAFESARPRHKPSLKTG